MQQFIKQFVFLDIFIRSIFSLSNVVEAKFDFRRLAQAATDKTQSTGTPDSVKADVEAQVTRLSTHPFSQFRYVSNITPMKCV